MSRQDNALIIRELADLLRKYHGQAHECIDIGGEMGRIRGAADRMMFENATLTAQLELTKGLQPNYFHDSHKAVDAFWKVWNEVGEPHKHGVYESTWMALRAAIEAIEDTNND